MIGWELRMGVPRGGIRRYVVDGHFVDWLRVCMYFTGGSGPGTWWHRPEPQINPSRLTWKFHHTTYNGHTSAVSALTFSFLTPWPSQTAAFAPVKISSSSTTNHYDTSRSPM